MVEVYSVNPAQVKAVIRDHRICRCLHGGGSICESSPGIDDVLAFAEVYSVQDQQVSQVKVQTENLNHSFQRLAC